MDSDGWRRWWLWQFLWAHSIARPTTTCMCKRAFLLQSCLSRPSLLCCVHGNLSLWRVFSRVSYPCADLMWRSVLLVTGLVLFHVPSTIHGRRTMVIDVSEHCMIAEAQSSWPQTAIPLPPYRPTCTNTTISLRPYVRTPYLFGYYLSEHGEHCGCVTFTPCQHHRCVPQCLECAAFTFDSNYHTSY